MSNVNNKEDIIDSRDVIERIEELESEIEEIGEQLEAERASDAGEALIIALDHERETFLEELAPLKDLAKEAEGYAADWLHGETLIRDSYFREYAEELAVDCGMVDKNASWPNNHIDWDAAVESLQQDYSCIDFDGEEYWIR